MRAAAAGLLVSSAAFAAGFGLPEQNARAIATGGTGTASAEGAGAIFYNPGSLGFEDGLCAEVSGLLIAPQFNYSPLGAGPSFSAVSRLFALPSIFVAAPVGPVRVGLGAFANYGLGLTWPAGFTGRYESTASNLQTFTFNPTLAWRFHEHVSVGAGFDLVRGTVELNRALDFVDTEGALRLGGDTWGFGGNLGVNTHWLSDALAIGLSWRSAVRLRFFGRADFTTPKEFAAQLADQDVSTTLLLPHTLSLGGSYRLHPKLRLSLDVTWTSWSTFDAIRLNFADDALDTVLERSWFDTVAVRAGAEFQVSKPLALRLGGGFDPSPSPSGTLSPSLPDASRVLFGGGAGYRLGNFSADLGYLFVLLLPRESTPTAFPARYSGNAHVIGLTVSFRQ